MYKFLYKILFSSLFFFSLNSSQNITAQNTLPINLEKVLELGNANNLTIKEYQQKQALAAAKLAKTKEWWLPEIFAGIRTHQLSGAAMNGNGNFFIDVDRDNLWAGLGLDMTWDFGNGIFKTKAANLRAKSAEFQTEAEKNKALLHIIDAYYDFMVAQQYFQAYQGLVEQSELLSQQLGLRLEAGLQYESDALLSKSNTNHLKVQLLGAKAEFGRKSAELVRLLNLDPTSELVSIDSIMSPLELAEGVETVVFEEVYQNRPDFKGAELALQSIKTEKKVTTIGLLIPEFRLGAYGSYFGDLNDPVSPMVPSQFPETNQLYSTSEVNAALLWKIPLGNLVYKGDVKTYDAKIELQQNKIAQVKAAINEEVLTAKQALLIAKEQIEIAFEGNGFAEKALEQSIQRQELKTIRPFEILQTQEIFIQSRLDYLKAVSDFNKAQYVLRVAKGGRL